MSVECNPPYVSNVALDQFKTFYNIAISEIGVLSNFLVGVQKLEYYDNFPTNQYLIETPAEDQWDSWYQVPISLSEIDLPEPVYINPTPIPDPYFPFNYNEDFYQSSLLDATKARLLHDVTYGGTGLSPDVEAAIFARENERDELALQDTIDKISADWSRRRFAMPNGLLAVGVHRAYLDWDYAMLDKARKITEESEKIAIENTRFVIGASSTLEGTLMNDKSGYWNRNLDGKKAEVNAGVQLFDSLVKKYLGIYEGWKAQAQTYEAKTRGAAAKWGSELGLINTKMDIAKTKAGLVMKTDELNIGQNKDAANYQQNFVTATAQVISHVVAGFLSALHASVGFSESLGDSTSRSCSYNESVNDSTSRQDGISYSDNTSRQDGISYTDHTAHDADIDKTRYTYHTAKDADIDATHKAENTSTNQHVSHSWDETAKDLRLSASSNTNLNYNHYYEET